MLLNGPEFKRLEGAISAADIRQSVIANNVANADTPKFKRSDVAFEQLLEQSLGNGMPVLAGRRTNPRHIPIGPSSSVTPQVITDEDSVMNNNGNNVDIDREMSLLAQNQLSYNFYVQQVNHNVKMMRTAIEGRA